MSDTPDLDTLLSDAWQHLKRGVANAKLPARFPTLATIAPDGTRGGRPVVQSGVEQSHASVELHDDIETNMVVTLRNTPVAALYFWIPKSYLQIRLNANLSILAGPEAEA
jgi:pyridoxamine 5'-phosphate oxidase